MPDSGDSRGVPSYIEPSGKPAAGVGALGDTLRFLQNGKAIRTGVGD